MFCPNCGRNVNDTAKFCVGCGTPLGGAEQQNQTVLLSTEPSEGSLSSTERKTETEPTQLLFGYSEPNNASTSEEKTGFLPEKEQTFNGAEVIKKSKKRKKISKKCNLLVLLIVLVVVGITAWGVIFFVSKTTTAKKVEQQLSLGVKYLSKLEYKQAIAAYEKALIIDPENTDAYIGLTDVYLAMRDYDKVEEILEEAKEAIKNAEDKDWIKQKEKKVTKDKEKEQEAIIDTLEHLEKANIGEYVTFGVYEQDNNLNNGAEPIEWLVLEKKDGKALVFSRYALDVKPYDEEREAVTWETSTLRSWLNDAFYTTAFNKSERSAIAQTLILNKDNPDNGTEGGNDTKDRVFLLSIEEVTTYFASDPDEWEPARGAKVSEYAKVKSEGAYEEAKHGKFGTTEYDGNCVWWLRSPGDDCDSAARVYFNGYVSRDGIKVDHSYTCVRPALWIAYTESMATSTQVPISTPALTPYPIPTKAPSSGKVEALKKASVGDYITFGTYEQDNNLSNGAEPIEWLVLEKKDGKALVLSKYALDCKKYNEEYVDVTWETCTLRSWLNDEFYTTAFNKTERSAVVQTLIKNEDNPDYGTEGGNDTKDKVFLLSIEEVTTYFDPDPDAWDPARRAQVTEYAIAQGGWYSTIDEYYGNGWWWLRSPGGYGNQAAGVDINGYVYRYRIGVFNPTLVVRPALWIAY